MMRSYPERVPRTIFHIDIDAFFASVEQMDHPEYAGRPVIVGAAPGGRGVVSTCSYEARAFGLHSAMPISEAFKRCPQGIYLPVRMQRYCEVSASVMAVFASFSPEVVRVSVDEAYLDMTGTGRLWGSAAEAAVKLREEVARRTGMGVSTGIAPNHYVAKIASGLKKPRGLVEVLPGGEAGFMRALPLEKLWGAGEKTRQILLRAGIGSVADLQAWSESLLRARFGAGLGSFLCAASRGEDPGIAPGQAQVRSMSTERTFAKDCEDETVLLATLRNFADELAFRCWEEDCSARTLVLKLRYGDFSTITRQTTRPAAYSTSREIYTDAKALLAASWQRGRALRLLGLGLSGLNARSCQDEPLLFCEEDSRIEQERKAEATVFALDRKGKGRMVRAATLGMVPEARATASREEPDEDHRPGH